MCNALREELISFCDDNSPNRFTTCCLGGSLIVEGSRPNAPDQATEKEVPEVNQSEIQEQDQKTRPERTDT